jgi:hypothetical protein
MRQLYRPMRPDLDNFLFAAVGEEIDGMPLSMISALTRLGLDPWDEAGRLSSLGRQEAIAQLAQMIVRLPGTIWSALEARRIAGGLIDLLPRHDIASDAPAGRSAGPKKTTTEQTKLWLIGLILGADVLVSVIAYGG